MASLLPCNGRPPGEAGRYQIERRADMASLRRDLENCLAVIDPDCAEVIRALRQYRDEYIQTHAAQYVSFEAWKQGGSVEERLIERLELGRSGRI